jgi:hypothetical protein
MANCRRLSTSSRVQAWGVATTSPQIAVCPRGRTVKSPGQQFVVLGKDRLCGWLASGYHYFTKLFGGLPMNVAVGSPTWCSTGTFWKDVDGKRNLLAGVFFILTTSRGKSKLAMGWIVLGCPIWVFLYRPWAKVLWHLSFKMENFWPWSRKSRMCLWRTRPSSAFWASQLHKIVTWLTLSVLICLFQRLSHACLSISNLYSETANGSLNQLSFIW